MDEGTTEVVQAEPDVSPVPWQLELVFWFPVVCVFAWFAFRLFNGSWVDQPVTYDPEDDVPRLDPAGPNVEPVDPAAADDEALDAGGPSH